MSGRFRQVMFGDGALDECMYCRFVCPLGEGPAQHKPRDCRSRQNLRDSFAGAALTGFCASDRLDMRSDACASDQAFNAYALADAMLAERESS